jgi:hypothetical protein
LVILRLGKIFSRTLNPSFIFNGFYYSVAVFPWGVPVHLWTGAETNPLNLNQIMLAEESGMGLDNICASILSLYRPIWLHAALECL